MANNNDPLGIMSSLWGLTKTPAQPSPRRQALIDRLAAVGMTMRRKGPGWQIGSDWTNNLRGVEDLLREYELPWLP